MIPSFGDHVITVRVTQLQCKKCTWQWTPRTDVLPKVCPKCKNKNYDKPKNPHVGRKPRLKRFDIE